MSPGVPKNYGSKRRISISFRHREITLMANSQDTYKVFLGLELGCFLCRVRKELCLNQAATQLESYLFRKEFPSHMVTRSEVCFMTSREASAYDT